MMRALLDTMIFDEIVADQSLKADVLKVVGFGEVVILSTHLQEDQIGRIPDQTMRDEISVIPRTVIATGAAVWDHSNWDEAKFDEGIGPATVDDVFRGNPRDIPDALVAATLSDADVLVTEDKDLRKRVEVKARGRVWSFEQFSAFVKSKVCPAVGLWRPSQQRSGDVCLLARLTTAQTKEPPQLVEMGAIQAWAKRERPKGRPELELTWASCVRELGLLP